MKSKLEQLYDDQTIICKGLSLLKVYVDCNEIGEFLTKEQQERLIKLRELELYKLAVLENEVNNGK